MTQENTKLQVAHALRSNKHQWTHINERYEYDKERVKHFFICLLCKTYAYGYKRDNPEFLRSNDE